MSPKFEWDPDKELANILKHGVDFAEAAEVFDDPLATTIPDESNSSEERRFATVGQSAGGRVLFVSHTSRGDSIRIIGARRVTPRERRVYEEGED